MKKLLFITWSVSYGYGTEKSLADVLNRFDNTKYDISILPLFKYSNNSIFNNNIKVALATANSSDLYLPCIKRLDIEKYFSYIIDVNSCSTGKDTPEIYDKVASFFNIDKKNTLVIEDSLTAIKTAFLNGYNVVISSSIARG